MLCKRDDREPRPIADLPQRRQPRAIFDGGYPPIPLKETTCSRTPYRESGKQDFDIADLPLSPVMRSLEAP
jgi:hypothetical protein